MDDLRVGFRVPVLRRRDEEPHAYCGGRREPGGEDKTAVRQAQPFGRRGRRTGRAAGTRRNTNSVATAETTTQKSPTRKPAVTSVTQ